MQNVGKLSQLIFLNEFKYYFAYVCVFTLGGIYQLSSGLLGFSIRSFRGTSEIPITIICMYAWVVCDSEYLLGSHLWNNTGCRTVTMAAPLLVLLTSGPEMYEAVLHSCGTSLVGNAPLTSMTISYIYICIYIYVYIGYIYIYIYNQHICICWLYIYLYI